MCEETINQASEGFHIGSREWSALRNGGRAQRLPSRVHTRMAGTNRQIGRQMVLQSGGESSKPSATAAAQILKVFDFCYLRRTSGGSQVGE